jgi:predicted Zn-dependent protease
MHARIPVVNDPPLEAFVNAEATRIIEVSEDRAAVEDYRIFVSDFPRRDILGLSIQGRRIYISYALAKLAFETPWHLWLLRQTLAHEIGHETAGHALRNGGVAFNSSAPDRGPVQTDVGLPSFITLRNYTHQSELEADSKGLTYWRKLGWPCRKWVKIMESFKQQNYAGDVLHRTELRLAQAQKECAVPPEVGGTATFPSRHREELVESAVSR